MTTDDLLTRPEGKTLEAKRDLSLLPPVLRTVVTKDAYVAGTGVGVSVGANVGANVGAPLRPQLGPRLGTKLGPSSGTSYATLSRAAWMPAARGKAQGHP